MAGAAFSGDFADGPAGKAAILETGTECDLQPVGSRVSATTGRAASWIPDPLPVRSTTPAPAASRRGLPATAYEAVGSLGGSFVSPRI